MATRLGSYRRTAYRASGAVAYAGRRSPLVDRLLGGGSGGFVTAWNPHSKRLPDGRNRRMNLALRARLADLPHWPGAGSAGAWREEHFLIQADPRRLSVLARHFRQAAILLAGPAGRAARIRLLPR